MMGRSIEAISDVPCGSLVGLVGIDQQLVKTGTVTDHPEAYPIRSMKYSVSPVVRVAVQPKDPQNIVKLIEGLKKLSQSDPLVVCTVEQNGQHVVAGCGELHVEICLNDLAEYAGCELIFSEPIVTHKETVSQTSSQVCLAKSANKLNRLFA